MRVAIMQPYFLPYIGYLQLMAAVDVFVVYDNIEYTKKGWINRNRLLKNGKDALFSLPLKHDSDHLHVCQRELATSFDRSKLLNQFKGAYAKAPHFASVYPLLQGIVTCPEQNLFRYLLHSLQALAQHLGLGTSIRTSSTIAAEHSFKGEDKVLALCKALGANRYVNAIGGTALYSRERFASHGMELKFIQARPIDYAQFGAAFVPWLSIADVLMFNPVETVRRWVCTEYDLT